MENNRAGQAADDKMMHACCTLSTEGYKCTHTHTQYIILLTHCNSGCPDAPHCYVMHAWPVVLCVSKYKGRDCAEMR